MKLPNLRQLRAGALATGLGITTFLTGCGSPTASTVAKKATQLERAICERVAVDPNVIKKTDTFLLRRPPADRLLDKGDTLHTYGSVAPDITSRFKKQPDLTADMSDFDVTHVDSSALVSVENGTDYNGNQVPIIKGPTQVVRAIKADYGSDEGGVDTKLVRGVVSYDFCNNGKFLGGVTVDEIPTGKGKDALAFFEAGVPPSTSNPITKVGSSEHAAQISKAVADLNTRMDKITKLGTSIK